MTLLGLQLVCLLVSTYDNYHIKRNEMHINMHIQPLTFLDPLEEATSDKYAITPCASM